MFVYEVWYLFLLAILEVGASPAATQETMSARIKNPTHFPPKPSRRKEDRAESTKLFLLYKQSHSEIADILDLRIEVPTAKRTERIKGKGPSIPFEILPTIPENDF